MKYSGSITDLPERFYEGNWPYLLSIEKPIRVFPPGGGHSEISQTAFFATLEEAKEFASERAETLERIFIYQHREPAEWRQVFADIQS